MTTLASFEVIARILLLIGVGVVLRATHLLTRESAKTLNTVIVYVALPALVFQAVHPAKLELAFAGVVGIAWVVGLAGMAAAWAVGRALRLGPRALGGFILVAGLGNTGYLGYPVISSLFGVKGLAPAVFYDVFGTVALLLTVGVAVCARYGENEQKVQILREIVTFPAVIALVAALLLKPFAVPELVSLGLDSLSKMTVPLVMISVGLSLDLGRIRSDIRISSAAAGIKLLLLPVLAWVLARALLGEHLLLQVSVLEAGMPSMMLALVFGLRFGLDDDLIASTIVLTTIVSAVTLPALMTLVR